MKLLKTGVAILSVCVFTVALNADEAKPKRTLQGNMNEVYNTLPSSANDIGEAFANGMFYGRLRANLFRYDFETADNGSNYDNKAFGLGGSLIYKTAPLAGLSATAGFYYANSPFDSLREDNADVSIVKSGKDTFSRYDVSTDGDWHMAVLAQAYLQYDLSKTSFKFGRQFFESALTASNDTKMIPNAFEGLSFESKEIPKTTLKGAYLTTQKLRDHTTFHDVLTFKDSSANSWNNNDDSGVHKGLSYANFVAAGEDTEHELVIAAISNSSLENLKLDVTYTAVPDVVSSVIGEINYKINLPDGFSLTPGFRYMEQIDEGGGDIGGASLSGSLGRDKNPATLLGYKDRYTLDGSAWMARLVLAKGALQVLAGYSDVADEADLVAPWRAFPTGGYTRAMAQTNWIANTKSTMGEVSYDFGKAQIIKGFKAMGRYVIQDFDERKQAAGAQADMSVIHIDLVQQLTPQLDARVRFASVDAENRTSGIDKDSYNEYRFEINYLF